jgi:hypothetical protein
MLFRPSNLSALEQFVCEIGRGSQRKNGAALEVSAAAALVSIASIIAAREIAAKAAFGLKRSIRDQSN